MSLLRQGKAQVLTIYLGESDQWQGTPLYVAIVQFLREQGCAGATVARAVTGYGAGARLHESGGWRWSSDAPVVIQVVDQPDRLRRLLPHIQEMLTGGLMTLHEIEVLKYTHARRRGLPTKLPVRQVIETDGTLVGMVTRADLLQLIVTSPLMSSQAGSGTQPLRHTSSLTLVPVQQQPVADYLNPEVATVAEQTPLAEVIDALILSPLKRVVVTDSDQHVKGIISDVDVLARAQEEARPGLLSLLTGRARNKPVRLPTGTLQSHSGKARVAADIMNSEVVTVSLTTLVQEAIERMVVTNRKVLPVLDDQGRLAGVVGRSDLLRVLLEG